MPIGRVFVGAGHARDSPYATAIASKAFPYNIEQNSHLISVAYLSHRYSRHILDRNRLAALRAGLPAPCEFSAIQMT